MSENHESVDRRAVLRAAGATVAASVGAVGSVSASSHCFEDNCVETSVEADAYDTCGASSPSTSIYEGRDGFIWDTCTADGVKYAKVAFGCKQEWWIECSDLESSIGCMC